MGGGCSKAAADPSSAEDKNTVRQTVWKVLKGESDGETPIHGFMVQTKMDLNLSAPSNMVDAALLVVKVVVELIQAFRSRNQFLKAIQDRVQTLAPSIQALKAVVGGKAASVVQPPLQQLVELLCEYHRFVEQMIDRTASGKFVDSVKDFFSASGDLAALDEFDKLITRALADLSMPLQVEQLQRMDEQTQQLRAIGEKMQALTQNHPNLHPQVRRCLTNELALSFWIEFFPSDFLVTSKKFSTAIKDWLTDYQGVAVTGDFLDRLVAAIDTGDAENDGQSDGKIHVKEVNAFFCDIPLWAATSTAYEKTELLHASVSHLMHLQLATCCQAVQRKLADETGGSEATRVEAQLYVPVDCSQSSALAAPHTPLLDEIGAFLADPSKKGHVLLVSGGAGTGKSTVVERLMTDSWAGAGRRAFSVKLGSLPPDQAMRLVAYAVRQWIKNEGVARMV